MDYSSEVRQRFSARTGTGEVPGGKGDWCEGAAEDRSLAVWVRFQVEVEAGEIGRVRFRAFGCPHTVAAADRVAALLAGQPLQALTTIDWPELAREIELPREKFGKLLRIEDALAACYAQATRKRES